MPIRVDDLEAHQMHSEWVEIPEATAVGILKAKTEHRRVIAIGTTTTRALEGAAQALGGTLAAWHGEVNIFISPGFEFKVIDGLLTNFHLPKSTLLVLVSALAGREKILAAYHEAVERKYRFYSFGDAMLIA
jgi:S-adenosylmethionine:tRNA ribosyltransferase-isomerase